MPICISTDPTSITVGDLAHSPTTGEDYNVVVNTTQSTLKVKFTPAADITAVEVTNAPAGGGPSTGSSSITFSTGDGTPTGGVDYWIVNVSYKTPDGDEGSSSGLVIDDIPTKAPKFKPVSSC